MSTLVDDRTAQKKGLFWSALAYLIASAAAVAVISAATKLTSRSVHPLWIAAGADLAATLVVYGFSYALNNSSIYDPYWSIAPPLLGLYWAAIARPGQGHPVRSLAVLALVGVWAVRLTWNCLRRWGGLGDEDWRYRDLRAKHPRAYWWISLIGLHLMPTLVVYLGCLALYTTLSADPRPLNGLDAAALLVTGGAIWVEARADWELWRYQRSRQPPGPTLNTGLWKYARHPNYLGEMTFWWGLFLFALAADPGAWWTIAGPLAITALFTLVSIPMMERHMQKRRQ